MTGRKRYDIHCKTCAKSIGVVEIINDQKVRYIEENGLYTCRKRKDGYWGFHCCICNSYSIVAPEEVDKVVENPFTVTPARRFFLRNVVANRKTIVKTLTHGFEVDGFIMTEVTP